MPKKRPQRIGDQARRRDVAGDQLASQTTEYLVRSVARRRSQVREVRIYIIARLGTALFDDHAEVVVRVPPGYLAASCE